MTGYYYKSDSLYKNGLSSDSHYMYFKNSSKNYTSSNYSIGTSGATMTIPAYYAYPSCWVYHAWSCPNYATLKCHYEYGYLSVNSKIKSGTVRITVNKYSGSTSGRISFSSGLSSYNRDNITSQTNIDVPVSTFGTGKYVYFEGLVPVSVKLVNCDLSCETGGSIYVPNKIYGGKVYLKVKTGNGTGKMKFTNINGNTSEHSVTSTSGEEYSANVTDISSGNYIYYSFPNNIYGVTAISARHVYTIPTGGTLSWDTGDDKRVKSVSLTLLPLGSGSVSFSNVNSSSYNTSFSSQKTITIDAVNLTSQSLAFSLTNAIILSASVKYVYLYPCVFSKSNGTLVFASNSYSVSSSSLSWDSSTGLYYRDLSGTRRRAAFIGLTKIEELYDIIDFCSSTSSKNGALSSGLGGSKSYGLHTVSSASNKKITSTKLGDLELTVAPSMSTTSGTITMKYGSDTAEKTICGKTTIYIPYSDLQKSGTEYYMSFDCANIVLLTVKLVKWQPRFPKLELPNRSSVIDFSQDVGNKPAYNANLCMYDDQSYTGTVTRYTKYDSSLGYWYATNGWNDFLDKQPYSKNDFFITFENVDTTAFYNELWYGNGTNNWHTLQLKTYLPGVIRAFSDYKQNWPMVGFSAYSGKSKLIHGVFTQPINAVLYNYIYGTNAVNLDRYISPEADFNRATLKRLTTDACAKLKADYGSNVRVYVIKYREQDKWNALTRDSSDIIKYNNVPVAHDYTAIDNCAATTGGKAYDAANKTELRTRLDAIAADIKSWAEYQNAKNVGA